MKARARAPAGSRGGPLPPEGVRQKPAAALPATAPVALAVTVTRTRFAGWHQRASQCRCVALLAAPVAPGGCGGSRAAGGFSLSEGRPPAGAHCQWHSRSDDAAA
jgi:hypothetical protein